MNKKILLFTSILISILIISACASPAPAIETGISLVDGLGREITLEKPAENIITLSPPLTEMLYAVGAGEQVIGRDTFSDYPEDALALPDIGGGYSEYDLETILSLQPDMVIAGSINTPELVQSLEDLGLTVYYLSNPVDLEGTLEAINTIGIISGHEDEAQDLSIELDQRIETVLVTLEGVEEIPVVYYELDASDPSKPYTPGAGTYYSDLIMKAGGENIGDTLEAEWAQISLENLLVLNPDIIILGDAMWGVTAESLIERPGWESLSAVQSGSIEAFDDNLIARIGPRQVDGLEALAKILHPDIFK